MTYPEKTKWLRRYRQAMATERRLRDAIKIARARAESTTQALRPTPGSSITSDKVACGVELMDEYQQQLYRQLSESEKLRSEIEDAVYTLPDADQRHVLLAKYIDGLPWWQIANQLYISERWVRTLHRRALENLKTVPSSSTSPEYNCYRR